MTEHRQYDALYERGLKLPACRAVGYLAIRSPQMVIFRIRPATPLLAIAFEMATMGRDFHYRLIYGVY